MNADFPKKIISLSIFSKICFLLKKRQICLKNRIFPVLYNSLLFLKNHFSFIILKLNSQCKNKKNSPKLRIKNMMQKKTLDWFLYL